MFSVHHVPTDAATLARLRVRYETELFERVLPFWERHSPDRQRGGTFNNLDRDGTLYDTTKHVWLMGRQAWLFAKLYRTVEPRPEWIELAGLGIDFLREHAMRPDGRVFFALTRDGRPIYQQRKIFSECFTALALAEYGRAADRPSLVDEAHSLLAQIVEWAEGGPIEGRPAHSGVAASIALAVPMILLNLIEEIAGDRWTDYRPEIAALLDRVQLHIQRRPDAANSWEAVEVRETVAPDGALLDSPEGRLLNPGHAIEAGWFVQHWAQRLDRTDLGRVAVEIVRSSHRTGWDAEHGGLFYFLDAEGRSPTALEWSMKLWWPHCETLYAHLLDASLTGDADDWAAFEQTHAYTFAHFPDAEHGEWFGYLDREGRVTHRFKGGPYKGCFHVPRALWMCWDRLRAMEDAAPA